MSQPKLEQTHGTIILFCYFYFVILFIKLSQPLFYFVIFILLFLFCYFILQIVPTQIVPTILFLLFYFLQILFSKCPNPNWSRPMEPFYFCYFIFVILFLLFYFYRCPNPNQSRPTQQQLGNRSSIFDLDLRLFLFCNYFVNYFVIIFRPRSTCR